MIRSTSLNFTSTRPNDFIAQITTVAFTFSLPNKKERVWKMKNIKLNLSETDLKNAGLKIISLAKALGVFTIPIVKGQIVVMNTETGEIVEEKEVFYDSQYFS